MHSDIHPGGRLPKTSRDKPRRAETNRDKLTSAWGTSAWGTSAWCGGHGDVCLGDVCLEDVCLGDVCLGDVCLGDVYLGSWAGLCSRNEQGSLAVQGCAMSHRLQTQHMMSWATPCHVG